ncbi:MAG: cysteine desulfurase family protein [Eubacterium sp.]
MRLGEKMNEIYLDNAATTCPHPKVVEEMMRYYTDYYGNPSSLYNKGIEAEKAIKSVREKLAQILHCGSDELYFTSGGTEGNNTLIKGIVENQRIRNMRIITTKIEHPSILEVFKFYEDHGIEVIYLPVDAKGLVDQTVLKNSITEHTVLVSIMGVNNEIGTIQDLKKIGALIKEGNPHCLFHTDYVQGFMKVPIDVKACKIDALTLCAHKICGPKGVGAVYLRKNIRIKPLIIGGGQENNIRSGTENVPGIMGLGKAAELYAEAGMTKLAKIKEIKETMIQALSGVEGLCVNGDENGCPFILSLSFENIRGEVLLHTLEAKKIYISTGSACSSHKKEKQHVLRAIGLSEKYKDGTIRISFSIMTTKEEVLEAANIIKESVIQLRKLMNRKK